MCPKKFKDNRILSSRSLRASKILGNSLSLNLNLKHCRSSSHQSQRAHHGRPLCRSDRQLTFQSRHRRRVGEQAAAVGRAKTLETVKQTKNWALTVVIRSARQDSQAQGSSAHKTAPQTSKTWPTTAASQPSTTGAPARSRSAPTVRCMAFSTTRSARKAIKRGAAANAKGSVLTTCST